MKVIVKKKETAIPILITTEFIKLESALKLANVVASGGEAKNRILDGDAIVNDAVCTMRGKKLYPGDRILFDGQEYVISIHERQ